MDFEKIINNLKNNLYEVTFFENKEDAKKYLNDKIDNKTVGFGDSVTATELGLFDTLSTHNKTYCHAHIPKDKTAKEIIDSAMNTQIYITSVNAVSYSGEMVNIDGRGNRIASTVYGHEKVYIIIGKNKFVPTLEDAIYRARNIAAPKNAQRLKRNTPCAKNADKCYNCNSPERICNALMIHYKKPYSCDSEIIIINESLGY